MEFKVACLEFRVTGSGGFHHLKPEAVIEQYLVFLERILGGDHEPDFVQVSVFTQIIGQCQMTDMYGVEGTAEYSGPYMFFFHRRKLLTCQPVTTSMATAVIYSFMATATMATEIASTAMQRLTIVMVRKNFFGSLGMIQLIFQ